MYLLIDYFETIFMRNIKNYKKKLLFFFPKKFLKVILKLMSLDIHSFLSYKLGKEDNFLYSRYLYFSG